MRRHAALLGVLVATLAGAPAAHADGDPASDVLIGQDVYFPYTPPASDGVARALLELTGRTRKDGWPIKVALIATATDLGSVTALDGQPQRYADFLASEIGGPKVRLLVIMSVGFGGQNLGDGVDRALSGLPAPSADGDVLARIALQAVGRLAATDGHPVPVPAIDESDVGKRPYRGATNGLHPGSRVPSAAGGAATVATVPTGAGRRRSGSGTSPLLTIGAPVTVILLAIGVLAIRERRRADGDPDGTDGDRD